MVTPVLPHQNNIQQIGYKLLSMLNFKGKKGEEVARTLISACLWNDSVESKSRAYGVSPQTVRNYVEEQGMEVIEKLLESARKISLKVLKGVKEIDVSIDWTTKTWYGRPVGGLGSSEEGNSWNYATATTKFNGKVLLLAFVTQVKGMTKEEIVKALVEQVVAMGFKIRLITLDAGFYTVDVLNFISQFKYIVAVPVGDVKVYEEFDGDYATNSKRHRRDEQVKFRLLVYSKEKVRRKKKSVVYFARATNLDLPKGEVLDLYNKVRGPIETSYRNIKAFLPFTSSTKFVFRTLIFVLAVAFYSLYTVFKGEVRREQFRILLILLFSDDLFYLKDFLFKSIEPLINNIDLFSRR
ncbi:transposase IS4 family protein (plasmid) [Sulfolobus islandicus Y.N.15.51]|uniref:Transposase IS4 family protein n=1 Tax=Saccharolobus islandicus (strain Y.N.15.51 / Yellowstone \|nr:ISH3-like element ISSis6 family transposase [Sulfolobus islandicus]ACP48323.1 transposase IS4 family protein [Sulfolobus islandicus Y.N.15.51]ACP48987.1 transposase IS4 family protein [Sulfolobus islandicus Y.N.15.51]ACP50088.1 transposase IS4 family protein [Sulfolobus islandicus Y.N.15.51]